MSSFLAQSVMPIIDWALIAPEVIICLAAVIVMLVDAFVRPTQRWITGSIWGRLVGRGDNDKDKKQKKPGGGG